MQRVRDTYHTLNLFNQLGGAAGAQPGSGGNDLAISVDTIEAGSPQVTVASTVGIEVGDGVELIQNINNTAQIPANVTVASVDSATQFTMSAGEQTGQADIKVVNQNQTYLTVAKWYRCWNDVVKEVVMEKLLLVLQSHKL